MTRRGSAAAALAALALAGAGAPLAAAAAAPSDRSCLVAWNAPGNAANRSRLLAQRPISRLQLLPGITATDTFSKGSQATRREAEACLLTLAVHGGIRIVTGRWSGARVRGWTFGRAIPTGAPLVANVRLLPDGRVTKISRR